jgi:hypothetical protein
MMSERDRTLGYIRRSALAKQRGPFEQNALYAAPSIDYITLFLEEHPDFVEKLAQEQDKAIPELGTAVKKWLRNARRRKISDNGVPDCAKELCSGVVDFMRRIEFYTDLELYFGDSTTIGGGGAGLFSVGTEEPAEGFNWFLDKASFNLPISIPAFSYSGRHPCVRRNAFIYDTAIKQYFLKNLQKYGADWPADMNVDTFLEGLDKKTNLKFWLLHEEGEGKKRKNFTGMTDAHPIVREFAADYHAFAKGDKEILDAAKLDCWVREASAPGTLVMVVSNVLQSKNPARTMRKKIKELTTV